MVLHFDFQIFSVLFPFALLWFVFLCACCSPFGIFVDYQRKQSLMPNYYACSEQHKVHKEFWINPQQAELWVAQRAAFIKLFPSSLKAARLVLTIR